MEPTLLVGDHIFVNKIVYGLRIPYEASRYFAFRKPRRGDVIVFIYPEDPSMDFIKRVIGLEGEKVQLVDNEIRINDRKVPDPWGYFSGREPPWLLPAMENYGPVIVPKDSLFVLGDNRDNSEDSRFWGFVPMRNVLGKAFIIYLSWDAKATTLWDKIRWSRFGKVIH